MSKEVLQENSEVYQRRDGNGHERRTEMYILWQRKRDFFCAAMIVDWDRSGTSSHAVLNVFIFRQWRGLNLSVALRDPRIASKCSLSSYHTEDLIYDPSPPPPPLR